jgi:hypothetical protein
MIGSYGGFIYTTFALGFVTVRVVIPEPNSPDLNATYPFIGADEQSYLGSIPDGTGQ